MSGAQAQARDELLSLIHGVDAVKARVDVVKRIEAKLREKLPEGAKVDYVSMDHYIVSEDTVREVVEVTIDITEAVAGDYECFRYEGVEYDCSVGLGVCPVCKRDSPEFDEEKCDALFKQCVEEKKKDFIEDNCRLPMRLAIALPEGFTAWLARLEMDDPYEYCCGVALKIRYESWPYPTWIKELATEEKPREELAEYIADRVATITEKVIGLLKGLYGSL